MASIKNPQLEFSRIEYKYVISPSLADNLKEHISSYVVLDEPNKGKKPYTVRSIYFDSPSLTFGQEKIEGNSERIKVRLRAYPDRNDNPLFLEIKEKQGDRIYKERAQISSVDFKKIMHGDTEFLLESNDFFLKKCWYLFQQHKLKPKVANNYERISFVDKMVNCKISFDSNFFSSPVENICEKNMLLKPIGDCVIMEIKFDKFMPDYFLRLVKKYGLNRIPNSKYLLSLKKTCSKYLNATSN